MKSSPKPDETPPSTVSKTPVSGRKMVQARLPFKTLSGSEPPFTPSNDTMAAASPNADNKATINNENRKRKQSAALTPEDGVRAPKMNRLSIGDNDDDDVILLTSETMETSNMANDKQTEDDPFNQSSESKENVFVKKNDENESILLDSDDEIDGGGETEAITNPKTSKAKQSLSFSEPKSETRKSKRISDANSIRIKLPMTKKEKESVKKIKKRKKSESNGEKCESSAEDKMDADEQSTSVADQSALNDSILETENDGDTEKDEPMDKSMLNSSTISNKSVDDPSIPSNMLTPKQLQRRAECEKKMLEKQRAKLERERKLQQEKEQKRKEKEEKEEQKRKEREEREEQKRKEKEERERKVQEEKEQKQREKEERERKIQEEKEQKLREKEEKRKEREEKERKLLEEKEEKQRKKEEAIVAEQSKIRKTSEAFVKFFVPKKGDGKTTEDATEEKSRSEQTQQHFMSFQVKEGMRMAPVMRRLLNDEERTSLEKIIADKSTSPELYLSQLKSNKIIPRKFERTLQDDEDEKCSNDDDLFVIDETGEGVQVIEEKPKKLYRAKFFKFDENRRPPYYGTWRKKSKVLGPRKPFVQDSTFFNYEIDSDDDWEEEEPGESLHGSDDEKDHESEDDYDIDNEFFVPHGHLSDEEWQNEDEFDYDNAEDHKIKMQLIQKQFDKEMKKKTQKLKPRVIGLIWQNADGSQPKNCSSGVWNLLNNNSVYFEGESVKIEPPSNSNETLSDDEASNSKSVRRLKISEKEVPDLIRLINGNTYKIDFLSEEFRAFVAKNNPGQREFTTASIKNKIRELAMHQRCPEDGPMHNKKCWYVPIATRKRYNVNDLTFPNAWTYTIPPRRPIQSSDLENEKQPIINEQKQSNASDAIDTNEDSNNSYGLSETLTLDAVKQAAMKPTSFNIAKYIRVLSEEEKKKQFDPITMHGPTIDLTAEPSTSQSTHKKKPTKKRNSTAAANASNAQAGPAQKKRVNLLMSVARGEDFSPKTKNTLVSHFLTTNAKKRQSTDDDGCTSTRTTATKDSSKKKRTEETVIVIDD